MHINTMNRMRKSMDEALESHNDADLWGKKESFIL